MNTIKILVFIISTLTITLTFFGCGNLIPYAVQPSYHEFKQMCELNKLPNNEEKYNKILAYFDLSLDSLDWEELNKDAFKLNKENSFYYVPNIVEYLSSPPSLEKKTKRGYYFVDIYSSKSNFTPQNITRMDLRATWYTGRYHLEPKSVARSFELEWREDYLYCEETTGFYAKPKETK